MYISRRGFVGSLIGGVCAAAAVRTFPFRVYSFPRQLLVQPLEIEQIMFFAHYDTSGRVAPEWTVSALIDKEQRFFRTTVSPSAKLGEIWKGDLSGLQEIKPPWAWARTGPDQLILAADEANSLLL